MNYCDMCGEEVASFIEGSGRQLTLADKPRKTTPSDAKRMVGAWKDWLVWPTRWGIDCSCDKQRKEKLK
jgi:hypothetical protein